MIITSKCKCDLANPHRRIQLDAVQDDRYSRRLQISLYAGGVAFTPPQACTVLVRYQKPDGITGIYDALPDGTTAWSISGNTVTVALAPQVCTVPGQVALTVMLLCGNAQISCFRIDLTVHAQPGKSPRSEAYFHITGFLPQPTAAKVGQFLKVAAVKDGTITALETGSFPGNSTVVTGSDIPEYVTAEASRVARVVQQRQSGSTCSLLVCSDPHYSVSHTDAQQLGESILHCGQAMSLIRQQIHIDGAAMLGDLVWDGGENAAEAQAAMAFVNSTLAAGYSALQNFRAVGNHDSLANGDAQLTADSIFARIGIYNSGAIFDPDNRTSGFCYRDFPDHKLRLILLNTADSGDGSFSISQAQLDWFSQALALDSLGEGWSSVILSHHPLDWYGSTQPVMEILKNANHVLCCIHGHLHNFKVDFVTGTSIPRIAIPNVCFYRNNEYGTNGVPENSEGIEFGQAQTYSKTADSAQDTAFCVITLDRSTGRIYADHYGAGYSRVISTDGSQLPQHSITCELTGTTITTVPETVENGAAFAAVLTAEEGHTLQSVSITMDGTEISADAFDGSTIQICAVTGDLVITAVATSASEEENSGSEAESEEVSENMVSTSIAEDGSIFNGCGYLTGYRLNSSGTVTALDGAIVSGFIPYSNQDLCISGSQASAAGTVGNYLCLYDSSFARINSISFDNLVSYGGTWTQNESWQMSIEISALTNESVAAQLASAAYIRCSLGTPESESSFRVTLGGSSQTGYTNQVTASTDTDGTVYNGCGYLTDYRLDSSGVVALSGAITSGYIPYSGQVIRICGTDAEAVGTDGNYFCMYDSSYGHINTIDFYNMAVYGAAWEQVGDQYMLTIDPAALTNTYVQEQLASAAYIRASFGSICAAANFIVTLDESIA